jgi:hypothetical protein
MAYVKVHGIPRKVKEDKSGRLYYIKTVEGERKKIYTSAKVYKSKTPKRASRKPKNVCKRYGRNKEGCERSPSCRWMKNKSKSPCRKSNKWISHVRKVAKSHRGKSLKAIIKAAKRSYK